MLRLIYESGANNETTDITSYLRLYTWESTELAEEGSVGTSEITLDDPDGELDIIAWRRVWAYEDTATGSNSLIYYGWITDRHVERGTHRVGTSRVWRVSMVDQNAVLSFRVFRGSGASRPEESDVRRIEWMMDFVDSFGRAPIVEDEFVFGAGARDMDAVDYKGQYTIDLINDCAQHTGKNFFVYTKDNGYPSSQPTRGLWYGWDGHTAYSSPLRLTNDADDIDSVLTFAISEDTSLERRADRVYSGVYIQADNNIAVYEQSAATYNQFTQRDITVPAPNVKTVARATTRALRNLADLDTEEDRISTAVYLPAAKVNFIKAGMRVQFKATHLPDYEVYNWLRVLSRTVTEVSEADDTATPHYYVSLVLSQMDPPQTIAPPAAGPDVILEDCNTVLEDAGRNGFDETTPGVDVIAPGQVWFYSITNPTHDPKAYTEDFAIRGGAPLSTLFTYSSSPAFEQGLGPTFSQWAGRTGTITLPPGVGAGPLAFFCKADYSGTPAVNECWRVELTRVS